MSSVLTVRLLYCRKRRTRSLKCIALLCLAAPLFALGCDEDDPATSLAVPVPTTVVTLTATAATTPTLIPSTATTPTTVPTPTVATPTPTPSPTPTEVPNVRYKTLSSGAFHTCALLEDGTPICWGLNDHGQGSAPEGESLTAISSGYSHACGALPPPPWLPASAGMTECVSRSILQCGAGSARE